MNISIFNLAWQSAEKIFLNPSVLYKYEDIIKGVTVNGKRKKAVDINTTQAFGKKLNYGNFYDNKIKAMEVFDEIFLVKGDRIINELKQIRTREEMDVFEHKLYRILYEALLPNSNQTLLNESYNRIRKIVDLYIEHIVAMSEEIDNETRKQLMPLLFLPIDSWIINNEEIFDNESIRRWGLTRKSSFGEIRTKDLYDDMQQYVVKKANEVSVRLGRQFNVIYFDVFWNNRLNMPGCNLFGEYVAGKTGNMKSESKETKDSSNIASVLSHLEAPHKKHNSTSYPNLVNILINELAEIDVYLDKDYKCIKRKDGAYIFEAIFSRGIPKNIVTIWPNKQGGGDIRIVSIGKYENRRRFEQSDIGTNTLKQDLRKAYARTQ